MKKFIVFLLFTSLITCGYTKPKTIVSGSYQIDATKNSVRHNAIGLRYLQEHCYYAAAQEFKIAISLNPDTQSAAVSYHNLGKAYMELGFAEEAQDCFERAIKLYGLNFEYYKDLANCYAKMGKAPQKLAEYKSSKNPLNKVMVGLLYVCTGEKRAGMITLDSFCMSEPDLIITDGVRNYLHELSEQ